MQSIIYGLMPNIAEHSAKEIFLFLLILSFYIVALGAYIEKKDESRQYSTLIRYGNFAGWWRNRWIKTLLLSTALVGGMFAVLGLIDIIWSVSLFYAGWLCPLILWCVNICVLSTVQLICAYLWNELRLSVLWLIGIYVISVYGHQFLGSYVCFLPGSFIMLRRFSVMDGSSSMELVILGELIFIMAAGIFGHRLRRKDSCRIL